MIVKAHKITKMKVVKSTQVSKLYLRHK